MKNSIVYKVTWKHMKMNKRRTITAFFGIFFMVLLMTCVFAGKETAVRYLQDMGSHVKGKWHFSMYDMTEADMDKIQSLGYVKETGRSADYGFTEFPVSANPLRPYLYVKSYEAPCFEWMNMELAEGRFPEKKGEAVISQSAVDDGARLSVGDSVQAEYFNRTITGTEEGVSTVFPFYHMGLEFGETKEVSQDFPFFKEGDSFRMDKSYTGKNEELTIVGIVKTPWFEKEDAAGYLAFTCYDETAGSVFNAAGIIDLKAADGDIYEELREIAGVREIEFNDYVLSFSGDSSDSVVNFIVQVMTVFFLTVIVTAAVILIYNVFNISFEERSRYLGMLCSVGATGRQKRSSVYFEAFSLFLPALPLGILAGFLVIFGGMHLLLGFIWSVMSTVSVLSAELPVHLIVSWKTLLLIAAGSGVTVWLSAELPARKISKVGPIEAIRGNLEKGASVIRRGKKTYFYKSAEEMLAGNCLRYQKRKTRGMVRAAVIFMTVLIVVTAATQTVTKLINYRMLDTNMVNINHDGWDYCVTEYAGKLEEYKELKKEILDDEGVEGIREEYTGMFTGNIPREVLGKEYWEALHRVFNLYYHRELSEEEFLEHFSEGTDTMCFIAVDDVTFEEIAKVTDTDMKLIEDTGTPSAIVVQSGEVSTENWHVDGREAEKYEFHEIEHMTDLKTGENIPVTLYSPDEDKKVEFPIRIAGYATNEQLEDYFTFHSEVFWMIVNLETGSRIEDIIRSRENEEDAYGLEHSIYLSMNEKETGLIKKLGALTESEDSGFVMGKTDVVKTLPEALNGMIRVLMLCFVILTSVICLLNLYNSIHGWIAEQKPYFAMLVSVGMTQRQLRRMLLYEAGHILLGSCMWSVFISVPLIMGIKKCLTDRFGHVSIGFPWFLYLGAAGVTVVVILGFMMYHYHREKDYDLRTVLMV